MLQGDIPEKWWLELPNSLDAAIEILEHRAEHLHLFTTEGVELRKLLDWVQEQYDAGIDSIKGEHPLAFFLSSYEQSLMLNAWWCGITFPVCFSANRIGKTGCFVINALLWLFPNNPEWLLYTRYNDKHGREVHCLQRPPLLIILTLQEFLKNNPDFQVIPIFFTYTEIVINTDTGFAWRAAKKVRHGRAAYYPRPQSGAQVCRPRGGDGAGPSG